MQTHVVRAFRSRLFLLIVLLALVAVVPGTGAEMRFPVKKTRSLTSDTEIKCIRDNIATYPTAKKVADGIIKKADQWAARSDRYLWEFIPPPEIPRAFNSSLFGCPVHGMELFRFGNYSWKMDPFNKPWKLVCPVGGEEYPSNDFMAYFKTKDRSLLTGDYPDDGWGWGKPGDRYKHWLVAYYCEWLWTNYIIPAVSNLSLAYQITGDAKFARKAIVMLDRIADFYPGMDYNKQSMYAMEYAPNYQGKIRNLIWETGTIREFAEAYDNVFDALDSNGNFYSGETDSPLQGKANLEIRRNIESNLLNVGAQSVFSGQIRGNYGMHQGAILTLALVLQDNELTNKACDFVLEDPAGSLATMGFNYALDNMVHREGIAWESAPGYCFGWSQHLAGVGQLLDQVGVDIFSNPKFKRMFTGYWAIQVLGRFTPSIGDSGSVTSGAINLPLHMAVVGLEKFNDPIFAKYLLDQKYYGEKTLGSYASLKRPVLSHEMLQKAVRRGANPPSGNRNLGGYGLGILEAGSGDRKVGLSLYYGPTIGGHAHPDRLFFELYGFGARLIPDLGYPQFASDQKDRTAWESNTISHCTVTVDASQQNSVATGWLNQFAVSPDVKLLDVSAPDVYSNLKDYRRVMLLVGGESEAPYLVDFFTVKGGRSHDYSLHGFDGAFTTEGIELKSQPKGTLAGEDVPYSYLYDDPDLEKPDRKRAFGSYTGSGYSYLYNVERGQPDGTWIAAWSGRDYGIRAYFPEQDIQEAVTADGNPPKRPGNPKTLKYVLLRNSGEEGLSSQFSCVLQPYKTGDLSMKVQRIPTESGNFLRIVGAHGTDYVYLAEDSSREVRVGELLFKTGCAVVRMGADGRLKSVFTAGEGRVTLDSLVMESGPSRTGQVVAVDYLKNEVTLAGIAGPVNKLVGQTIHFGSANYLIHHAWNKDGKVIISLGGDSPRVGRLTVDGVDPGGKFIITRTALPLARAGIYRNRWLVSENDSVWLPVENVENGRVTLKVPADLKHFITDKDDGNKPIAYLYDIAPSQEYCIPATSWADFE